MTSQQLKDYMARKELNTASFGAIFGRGRRTVERWRSGGLPVPAYVQLYIKEHP